MIIAPHLIHESHLRDIEAALCNCKVLRYSAANEDNVAEADVLIIDCFGLLSSIYRYGRLAMVGGGFGEGIHNVPEAAVYGLPVLIGPNNRNFREARYLIDAGGVFEVTDAATFAAAVNRLLADATAWQRAADASKTYITGNAGATDIIYEHVFTQVSHS